MAYQLTEEERRNLLADLLGNPDQENIGVAQQVAVSPPMPQNWIQRGNNAPIDLGPSVGIPQNNALAQQLQPALDYTRNGVSIGGQTGHYVKGDPFTVMMPDGTKVSLGNDMAASRKRDAENLAIAQSRQKLEEGNVDTQLKKAQLAQGGKANVPSGYRMLPDGNMQAIPGGPADVKLAGQFNADTAQLQSSQADLDRLATSANELLKHEGLSHITGLPGMLPNVPGMAGADAQAKLNTLKSQVGFGVLQAMRNASKTGGALGSVSDAEGKRLEANLAALENAQSEKQFRESLSKIIKFSDESKGRLADAYNLRHNTQGSNPNTGSIFSVAKPQLSQQDNEAMAWANANPSDPRSAAIKAKLGVK